MSYFVMSKMALKWAFQKPATRNYPFEPMQPIANSRGLLAFVNDNCTYCTVCAKRCPTQAISVTRPKRTWALDRLRCISCGACVDICPKDCLTLSAKHSGPYITKDKEIYVGAPLPPKAPAEPKAAAPAPVATAAAA